jgi:hypothetical protein
MQGSEQTPKAPLGNNARPLQPLHHRTIRTNIDFNNKVMFDNLFIYHKTVLYLVEHVFKNQQTQQTNCPSMYREMYYKANKWTNDLIPNRGRDRDIDSIFHSFKHQP